MRVLVFAVLVLALGGCGPTADEIATTALTATPFAYGLGVLAVWGLHALWRERIGKTKPSGQVIVVGAVFAVLALFAGSSADFDADLFPLCAVLVSGVAVSLSMLGGRLRVGRGDPELVAAVTPAIVVGCIAAPFLIGWVNDGPSEEFAVSAGAMFVVAVGFYVATPLILGLLVETVWARARYRREHGPDASADPSADPDEQDAPWMVEERMYEQRLYDRRW